MNVRVGPLSGLFVFTCAAAAVCALMGCGGQDVGSKTLLAGLMVDTTAGVEVEVSTNGVDADDPTGPFVPAGNPIVWLYVVTNVGDMEVIDVGVEDDQGITVYCPKSMLAPGEVMICGATGVAAEGQYANVGTVSATDPLGNVITASDPSHYFGGVPSSGAGVDIDMTTNGETADSPPGPTVTVGDVVDFVYSITNTGSVELTNVAVVDSAGVMVSCPQTGLAAGESMTCTGSASATEGQYAAVGIVSATDAAGEAVGDFDWAHYLAEAVIEEPSSAVDIETATNGEDADEPPGPVLVVGDSVSWSYVVTNVGNVPLTDVMVSDDQGVVVTCPLTELAAGESMTCSAEGTAVAGQYANVGTVTALDPDLLEVSNSDPSHYYAEEVPVAGDAACGLGYWKNHLSSWEPTGYSPDQTLSSVFVEIAAFPGLADVTLDEALRRGGGPTLEDAAALLVKHAVAALLSAAHPDVNYGLTEAEVIDLVNGLLQSTSRSEILSGKSELARFGESCPLGGPADGHKGNRRGMDDDPDDEGSDED